jgi:hypothetical protein
VGGCSEVFHDCTSQLGEVHGDILEQLVAFLFLEPCFRAR